MRDSSASPGKKGQKAQARQPENTLKQKKVKPYVERPRDADPYSDVNPFYATGNHLIATSVTQDQDFKSPAKAEAALGLDFFKN